MYLHQKNMLFCLLGIMNWSEEGILCLDDKLASLFLLKILKILNDWMISQRKYILQMTAAPYFKWQYSKVDLSQTGKRHPDRTVMTTV